jgi:hypothetical protein
MKVKCKLPTETKIKIINGTNNQPNLSDTSDSNGNTSVSKPTTVSKTTNKNKAKSELSKGGSVTIGELARIGRNIKVGENFGAIKNLYAGSMIERILNVVEEAGEEGITPKNIMATVGIKFSSQLNPIMGELMELGAIVGPAPKEIEAEPEAITPKDDLANIGVPKVTNTPEDKEVDDDEFIEVDKDEWEKSDNEEESSTEKEPDTSDIQVFDKEIEKISNISTGKEAEINKVIDIVKNLSSKIKSLKKDSDEYKRKLAALKQYVNNNKSLLRGVSLESITNGLLS